MVLECSLGSGLGGVTGGPEARRESDEFATVEKIRCSARCKRSETAFGVTLSSVASSSIETVRGISKYPNSSAISTVSR